MKRIFLYPENGSKIEISDESDVDLDEYCKELSKLFVTSNIALLKTTSASAMLRPSKLQAVVVTEVDESVEVVANKSPDKEVEIKAPPKEKKVVDSITDK
jgi:hypothetical protein